MSQNQKWEAPFTDGDALWETIKSVLFACVHLPVVLSGSRQQTEKGSKVQEKQVHRLRRGEQGLLANGSRDKGRDFMIDNEPLKTVELSIERCLDIEQPSTTRISKARNAPTEGDSADSVRATEKDQV